MVTVEELLVLARRAEQASQINLASALAALAWDFRHGVDVPWVEDHTRRVAGLGFDLANRLGVGAEREKTP